MNDKIVLNIRNIFEFNKNEYNKNLINNIYTEILHIDKIFTKLNLIEILKLYKISKKIKILKNHMNIFLIIFKILSADYIDQYEYYLIIFHFFKLKKNQNNILDDIEKFNEMNIDLKNFYNELNNYIEKLTKKSNLIKNLDDLNKTKIDEKKLTYIFSSFSKDNSFYFDFDKIFNIFIENISINEYNKNFILKNKNICKESYNETTKCLNELYGLTYSNKYKNNIEIVEKYKKILFNIKNIN